MTNIILVLILLFITAGAVLYLYKAKKRGVHCVGCPYAKQCSGKFCNCDTTREQT